MRSIDPPFISHCPVVGTQPLRREDRRMTERAEPTIAVIVPNRNDSRYLTRCLRSVFDQPVPPDELIVVDDQSTDDSVTVIRAWVEGRPGGALIRNPVNLGVYGAIHEGLKHSRSEYALFLASNDFVLPGIFSSAKRCIAQAPGAGLWSAMAWIVDEENRPLRMHASPVVSLRDTFLSPQECLELAYRHGNWFTGATLIYRRGPLDEAGRFDKAYMGLSDLFTALIVAARHGAAYSPVPLCAIRKHEGSYLTRTLVDAEGLEDVLPRLFQYGTRKEPRLFTPLFNARTLRRFRFASIRSSGGESMGAVARRCGGWTRRALMFVDGVLPRSWRLAQVAAAVFI